MADPTDPPLPPGFTLDQAPPPGFTVDVPAAPQAAAPDPNSAPDGSGFNQEQMQSIIDYLPHATDAADLERYSLEVSGGRARIGNAQKVLNTLKSGHKPEDFRFGPTTYEKPAPEQKSDPLSMDNIRKTVGDALFGLIAPGFGAQVREVAEPSARAAIAHTANSAAFDYGPEVGGVIDTVLHGGSLDHNIAHERAILEGESDGHPVASAVGEVAGIVPTAAMGGGVADAANLGKVARGIQMAGEGAAYGSGAAGPDHRLEGAATGAVLAPAGAVALRGAAALPGLVKSGAQSVMEGSPGLARRIIAKAIKDDANTPETVGADIEAAHANGVPMALADTGENARGLLAAASRASGMARTVARDALEERQAGLADRVTSAIQEHLGPVANPHEVADQLMTKARDEAAPLYDRAYQKAGADAFSEKMKPLLQRPSMKRALANAYRIAQEEGRDPETLGLSKFRKSDSSILGADGKPMQVDEVQLAKAPSWQTMDYIKRGMDDVVESYRDPTTGKLNLDTEGRAINNTLRSFLGAFDAANPDYGAARAAYAGPVKGIASMNTGRKFLNMTADDIEARMRDMTPFEKQMAALGTRRAMAETVQAKGDTADVVNALVGTGKKRAMLARLFGDRKGFQQFVSTLGQEREGWRTFKQGLLGSPTAANVADDATLQAATGAADLVLAGGIPVATATRQAIKFFGVKVGKKAQEDIAAMLSNTDPAAIRELAAELRAKAQKRGVNVPRLRLTAGVGGKSAALAIAAQQGQ